MNLISLRQITESELPTLLQVLSGRASGGFPSPAADHYEAPISLDDLVDLRAPHVWLGETEGDSMSPAGILNGTKLVIDRARRPQVGNVVVAYIDNQPVVKRLDRQLNGGWMLSSDNPKYPPIQGLEEIEVFGVVTWSLTIHVPLKGRPTRWWTATASTAPVSGCSVPSFGKSRSWYSATMTAA
ncbi:LexA repressor [Pseudomonas syringae pv. actinidiae]|nr:LexA repressor [Pseudomonas syringae pv. actinidiae]